MSVGASAFAKSRIKHRCQPKPFREPKLNDVAGQCSPSLRISASLLGRTRNRSISQRSRLRIRQSCNGIDRPITRLEVVGDQGAGASGTGLNAALGRGQETVTSTSVRTIRKTLEVCVVSGGRGLLEAASAVIIAFDLDVPFG